ncbi:hypothetical protein C8R46DRAFT_1142033 [Mycena filopes]|nr:hypothetical protein C8R46DRAFT_1142033 [Mycena filopes]
MSPPLLVVLILLAGPRSVLGISIADPGQLAAEADATILWTHNQNDPHAFNIELQNSAIGLSQQLASSVDISGGRIIVHLPGNLPSRNDYTFAFVNPADVEQVFATTDEFTVGDGEGEQPQSPTQSTTKTQTQTQSQTQPQTPPTTPTTSAQPSSSSVPGNTSISQPPITGTSNTSSTPQPTSSAASTIKHTLRGGAIAGIVLSLALLLLGALFFVFLYRRRRALQRRLPLRYDHESQPNTRQMQRDTKFLTTTQDTQLMSPLTPTALSADARRRKSIEARIHGLGSLLSPVAEGQAGGANLELQTVNIELRARIMALEEELRRHVAVEASERPPGYSDLGHHVANQIVG